MTAPYQQLKELRRLAAECDHIIEGISYRACAGGVQGDSALLASALEQRSSLRRMVNLIERVHI